MDKDLARVKSERSAEPKPEPVITQPIIAQPTPKPIIAQPTPKPVSPRSPISAATLMRVSSSSEPSMPENPIVQSVPIRRAAGNALMREKTRQAEEAVTELWTTPQLFACTIGHPGVGYRLSADFSDKVNMDRGSRISDKVLTTCLLQDPNDSNRGPRSTDHLGNSRPKCVIGTEFVKSREGVTFLKCSTGRGWLPLHTPNVC